MSFFDRPILNSPYTYPGRHWELDKEVHPTDRILGAPRSSALWTRLAGKVREVGQAQTNYGVRRRSLDGSDRVQPFAHHQRSAPGARDLARAAEPVQWKVTPITQRLLQHWRAIQRDETQAIRPFFCQLEAVEAAIWLSEVAPEMGSRGRRFLNWLATANNFAVQPDGAEAIDAEPDIMRVAFKLATGAGKTTVMAMLIAWQALNALPDARTADVLAGFPDRHAGHHDPRPAPGPPAERHRQLLRPAEPHSARPDAGARTARRSSSRTTTPSSCARPSMPRRAPGRRSRATATALDTLETEGQMIQRVMGDLMGLKNVVVINDEAHHCYGSARRMLREADGRRAEGGGGEQGGRPPLDIGPRGAQPPPGHQDRLRPVGDAFFLAGSNWPEGTLFPGS